MYSIWSRTPWMAGRSQAGSYTGHGNLFAVGSDLVHSLGRELHGW